MTPNTMTLDEVRDELARMDGLGPVEEGTFAMCRLRIDDPTDEREFPDPYPATLDGAAAALLTEYVWCRYLDDPEMENGWYAWKRAYYNTSQSVPDTGDELLDRYRLALSCRLAEVKQ